MTCSSIGGDRRRSTAEGTDSWPGAYNAAANVDAVRPQADAEFAIDETRLEAFSIPTDRPESDGTLTWDSTTLVVASVRAAGRWGLGYTYAHPAAAMLAARTLGPAILGADARDVPAAWATMVAAVRNLGRPGIASTAISAIDIALWDLKGRLLGRSLTDLLGQARPAIAAYGSGGFTSYGERELATQLEDWASAGFTFVKMKVGREPAADPGRVATARKAIGPGVGLFVDANGAYGRKFALAAADRFADFDVSWFEEPVSSDDVEGLRVLRDRAPVGMQIAAGEYAWDQFAFRRLLEAGAVDVIQADATRCLGITGFLMAAALCEAHAVPLSTHCAPALHVALACAARPAIHLEWFHDHARIERMLFDGAPWPIEGMFAPDRSRPGLGIDLRTSDAAPHSVWRSW